jgi:hypothetical protein
MEDVRNIEYFGLDENQDEEQDTDSNSDSSSHKRKRNSDEDFDMDSYVHKMHSILDPSNHDYDYFDYDSDDTHLKRLKRDDYMDISSNEYDYSESVVDDNSEINDDSEEHECVSPTHDNIIEQLQTENAELREAIRNQSRIVFPDGYHIGFMMEDGVRYLQVFNGNPIVADNGPLTLADLDCEQSEQDSDMDI